MYGNYIQKPLEPTAILLLVERGRFMTNRLCKQLWSKWRKIFAEVWGKLQVTNKSKQLLSAASKEKRHNRRGKWCWQRCSAPRPCDATKRSSQWKQLQTGRMIDVGMWCRGFPEGSLTHSHSMKLVWVKVCEPQALLMDQSLLWSSSRRVPNLHQNTTEKVRLSHNSYGVPSHTSNLIQQWCKNHFSLFWNKNIWPPSSLDINTMEFTIWSILESDVSAKSYSSVADLKNSLLASWSDLNEKNSTAFMPLSFQSFGAYG